MAVKIFFSYTHKDPRHTDEPYVRKVIDFFCSLEREGKVSILWDRKLKAGADLFPDIAVMMNQADIILLFVSANYLASETCIKEVKKSAELRDSKGIVVIPIIVSRCPWLDNSFLSSLLALPSDGKEISTFEDQDEAYMNIYSEVKKHVDEIYQNQETEN